MKKKIIPVALALLLLISLLPLNGFADEVSSAYIYGADGQIDLLGYFQMEGITAQLQEEAICFTLTAETASITFARPLTADGFSIRWNGVDDGEKKVDTLAVTISDKEQPALAVSLNYQKMNEQYCSVKYNGTGRTYLAAGSLYKQNDADTFLYYSREGSSFSDGAGFNVLIEKYLDGTDFKGFSSGAVNMRMDITGQVGGSFLLKSINEQRFGSQYAEDDSDPVLGLPDHAEKALYQSVVTVGGAVAYDVLSSDASVTLTVKDPAGEIVKDINGTALEDVDGRQCYQFRVEQFGTYNIGYKTSDGINTSRSMGYRMNVLDNGGPVITIDGTVPALTVGQMYTFPTMTVTDNAEDECTSWITVLHPSGILTRESTSFVPEQEGNYTIMYMAVDSSGNVGKLIAETHAKKGE
jgi:hypothetical protein